MIQATIQSVKEENGQYGPEKISRVLLDDGESKTVYTKPKAATVYAAIKPGLRVELMAKNSGAGYLIKSIIGEAATQPQPGNGQAPERQEVSKKDIAGYIHTSAGQYAYAVKCMIEIFGKEKLPITDDLIKAGATSIFIAVKDKFH